QGQGCHHPHHRQPGRRHQRPADGRRAAPPRTAGLVPGRAPRRHAGRPRLIPRQETDMTETIEAEVAHIERAYQSGLPVALAQLEELKNIADRLAATCADPVAVADYLAWKEN